MPVRSTPFQAMVRLVREHFVAQGVTVTESKMLRDAVLGIDREVDIVVEGEFDGDATVTSIEVTERSRPATLPWVQETIRKHENLPTNVLILVSKAGFTADALRQVAFAAGKVRALKPEVIERDGLPVVNRLYADVIKYAPKSCTVFVRMSSGAPTPFVGEPGFDVYDAAGVVLGQLSPLVYEALRSEPLRKYLAVHAHCRTDKEAITYFTVGFGVAPPGFHLRHPDSGALHLIEAIEVTGPFTVTQTEIPLTMTDLGGRLFGQALVEIDGHPTQYVGTNQPDTGTARISWRRTDRAADSPSKPASQIVRFPGLAEHLAQAFRALDQSEARP